MDCKEAEELFVGYLLGALDPDERSWMDSHLDTCQVCSLKLQGDGETVARLAFAVPQLVVPPQVKHRLLSRMDADSQHEPRATWGVRLSNILGALGRNVVPHAGKAIASAAVLGVVLGGVWFNGRLDKISEDNEELSGQVVAAAETEANVMAMVKDQRQSTYEALRMSAMPGTSVNMLWDTHWPSRASGMMMVSRTGTQALLLVLNLPPLPPDQVYQVWLIKDGQKHDAGTFTVDSTGFGQAVIIPVAPVEIFEVIGVTAEPAGGSADPTGIHVLEGDL